MTSTSTPENIGTLDETAYLAHITQTCTARGISLTAIRREALALLYRHPNGIKAYDLLDQMRQTRQNATPPTVYRALDFLIEQGFAHKIGRMNLFVACRHASHKLPGLFLLCPRCNGLTDLDAPVLMAALTELLAQSGHCLDAPEVEISAICPACLQADKASRQT